MPPFEFRKTSYLVLYSSMMAPSDSTVTTLLVSQALARDRRFDPYVAYTLFIPVPLHPCKN